MPQEILKQRLENYDLNAKGKPKNTKNDTTKQFLLDFFSILDPEGQTRLARDTTESATDSMLRQLVKSIDQGILIAMKLAGGKTLTDGITVSLQKGIEPIGRDQEKLREHCLKRDGYRCVASRPWSGDRPHPDNALTTSLQAAHIIPFSLGSFNENSKDDVRRHASTWVNINRYFPSLVKMGFNPEHLNDEKNVMIMDKLLHDEFGAFRFCFVATGETDHQYYMKTYKDTFSIQLSHLPADRIMTFRSHEGKWDLPDPELLRIHAALCDFFHMSGHGERVDKILRDFEEPGVFAHDGSTNVEELLASRLLSLDLNTREL